LIHSALGAASAAASYVAMSMSSHSIGCKEEERRRGGEEGRGER